MARPATPNDTPISLRVPDTWLKRADSLIEYLSKPGIGVTRSDVLRSAIARGLDAIEAERDVAVPPKRKR
jgi:hypothetical protein